MRAKVEFSLFFSTGRAIGSLSALSGEDSQTCPVRLSVRVKWVVAGSSSKRRASFSMTIGVLGSE